MGIQAVTRSTAAQLGGANRCAFLDTIAWSEIGPALLAASDDGYDVLVGDTVGGGALFHDYTTHPDALNKRFDSTAAGRYQIIHPTWLEIVAAIGLKDFSPLSQDLGALWLARAAMPSVDAGDLADAVTGVSHIWASLPGSLAGQRTNSFADLQAAYVAAGGNLA